MLSLIIHAGHEGSDQCRKKAGYIFFLQCRHLHAPHKSTKKAFYCLNICAAMHTCN